MEKKNPLNELLQDSMAKVREMVDTNTIVYATVIELEDPNKEQL